MVAFDGNRGCVGAAPYYHDFLLDPNDPSIPGSVIAHLGVCEHCRAQVRHWEEVLRETEGEPCRTEADRDLIAELQLHFEHLGQPLNCRQVKPLLPSLLMPSPKIRIPTPVTVHVDHCAECAADLAILGGLGLDSEQLTRLGRLYAESSAGDSRTCQEAPSRVAILGSVSGEEVEDEVLQPRCTCHRCRDRAYAFRQEWLDRRRDRPGTGDICNWEISPADLFDCVVPLGRAGAEDAGASRRTKATGEHLRSCPRCLERLQALHRAVYGVADRGDSDVVTVCTTRAVGQEGSEEAQDLYAGHPIEVEVIRREPGPVAEGRRSASGVRATLGRAASNPFLRPLLKTAFLAAAVIPLVIVFWISASSASGWSIQQLDLILASAPAVRISTFSQEGTEPIQEFWMSRPARTIISETRREQTVYYLARGRKIVVGLDRTSMESADLSRKDHADLKQWMECYLAYSVKGVGADAGSLRAVADEDAGAAVESYELLGKTTASDGRTVPHKWVLSVAPSTRLPVESRFYTMATTEGPWELETIKRFEYPSQSEIEKRLKALPAPQ